MAPKKRPQPVADQVRGKKAKAAPSVKAEKTDVVLVQRDEQAEAEKASSSAATAKPSARESLEAKVSRCLRDNFKGWSYNKTDFTIRNGMSLREKLRNDKELQEMGDQSFSFGKLYFAELRALYGSEADPEKLINVKDESELADPKLEEALEGLFDRQKDFDSTIELLENLQECNQRTYVGLLQGALTVNPCSTLPGNRFVMAVMKFIIRLNLHSTFPEETSHMRAHFDLALQKTYMDYKKNDMGVLDWWQKYHREAALVIPSQSAEACFACKTQWSDAEEHLLKVVNSGELGYLLFGKALNTITASKIAKECEDSVASMLGQEITPELITQARSKFVAQVKGLGVDALELFKDPRQTEVKYRGLTLTVPCVSLVDQWNFQLWGVIKTVSAQAKQIDSLFCEDLLVVQQNCYPNTKVEETLLGDVKAARKAAGQYLSSTSEVTPELLKAMFLKRGSFLRSIDRAFKIEELFFDACSGSKGEDRYRAELLACLPDKPGSLDPEKSLGFLMQLGGGKLASWAGTGCVAMQQMVVACVKSLNAGRPPKFDASANSSFSDQVKARLANFLVLTPDAGSSDATVVSGKDAAKRLLEDLQKKRNETKDLSLKDLQRVMQFAWLLCDSDKQMLEGWRKEMVSSGPDVLRPASKTVAARNGKMADKKKCVTALFKKH